jgi:hypothetical protein
MLQIPKIILMQLKHFNKNSIAEKPESVRSNESEK